MSEPITILIVDDNTEKTREVVKVLVATGLSNPATISDARDATTAKRLLKSKYFDLVIVDIALPLRIDQDPDPKGGLELLQEVLSRPGYKRPGHIVGLTAFEQIFSDAETSFGQFLWSVIQYDQTSAAWADRLTGRLRHIAASIAAKQMDRGFDYDLAIVCAMDDPELQAIRRLSWGWTAFSDPGDATQYYNGAMQSGGGARRVVAASAPMMGSAASSALTMKMIARFRPRYLVHAGLMAGSRGSVELGDVVVGNPVWDWESGKHYLDEGTAAFAVAPHQFPLSPQIRGHAEQVQSATQQLQEIKASWPGTKPSTSLCLHIGPVSSGSSVIADPAVFARVRAQHRKLLGVEMEAYGVLAAIDQAPYPQPAGVVIKAVQDFGDERKSDDIRHYAAHTSARVTALIAERFSYVDAS